MNVNKYLSLILLIVCLVLLIIIFVEHASINKITGEYKLATQQLLTCNQNIVDQNNAINQYKIDLVNLSSEMNESLQKTKNEINTAYVSYNITNNSSCESNISAIKSLLLMVQ